MEQKVEKEVAFARQHAKTNKRAALAALKRKKRFKPHKTKNAISS